MSPVINSPAYCVGSLTTVGYNRSLSAPGNIQGVIPDTNKLSPTSFQEAPGLNIAERPAPRNTSLMATSPIPLVAAQEISGQEGANLADGVSGLPWLGIGEATAVLVGALIVHHYIGKGIDKLAEQEHTAGASKWTRFFRSGLKWTRRLMWGAAIFAGLDVSGISLNNLLLGAGGAAAVATFTLKDMISNWGSYLVVTWRNQVKKGDYISLGVVSGQVTKMSPFCIEITSYDDSGNKFVAHVAPSLFLSSVVKGIKFDKMTIRKIKVGHYIGIGGKIYGKVVSITDQTVCLEQEDMNGKRHVLHVSKLAINADSLVCYDEYPPKLPEGIGRGSKIEYNGRLWTIKAYNAWYVWMESDDGKTKCRLSRSVLQSALIIPHERPTKPSAQNPSS